MNESLILRWNTCVAPQDVVLHLGDVGFNYGRLFNIVARLNGRKLLVRGNHDWNVSRMKALGFECITAFKNQFHKEPYHNRMLICAHRPRDLPTWDPEKLVTWDHRNVVLCGHEHNNGPLFIRWVRDKGDTARPVMALNMSCEHWNYAPQHVDRVIEAYDKQLASVLK